LFTPGIPGYTGELLCLLLLLLRIDGSFYGGDAIIHIDVDSIVLEVWRLLELRLDPMPFG